MAWSQNGLVTEWLGHRARRMNNNDHLAHNPALQGSRGRVNNLQVSHFALQIEHQQTDVKLFSEIQFSGHETYYAGWGELQVL